MIKKQGETSFHDTSFGIIPRSKLILLEIEGIRRAWNFVTNKGKARKINISPSFIKKIHKVGFSWIFPQTGGKFRTIEVTASEHIPPKYFFVPQYMDDYCKDIKERIRHLPKLNQTEFLTQLISFLAWAHHKFLWIHPFTDYKGRISRLLLSVILLNLDIPPIELKVETKAGRKKYIHALKNADTGDYSLLESLIKQALEETIKEL